jgi:phosphate transport system substrate-binding protein
VTKIRLSPGTTIIAIGAVVTAIVTIASCSRSGQGSEPHASVIDGCGATLPFPLYAKWSSEFSRVDTRARVNYQPLGSGAGIRQVSDGVVDFGATDEPMSDEELKRASQQGSGDLVHVPMTIGAVVVTFNAPGVTELKLTPDVVADVFRGVVSRWDDPRLRAANPTASLPARPITVIHRADGSGTSATFTAYLSKNSAAWKEDIGAGTTPRFPVGIGARGNDGVTAQVKSTPFAIGYVELAYARQASLPIALVRNRSGSYVAPSTSSLDHAARSFITVPMKEDLRISIVDSTDPDAYPIAALSFLILPRDARHRARADSLARFVWWSLHDGQRFAEALDYAPLPPEYVAQAERLVRDLRAEGKPLPSAAGIGP